MTLQEEIEKVRKSDMKLLNSSKLQNIENSMKYHYIELMALTDFLRQSDSHDQHSRQKLKIKVDNAMQKTLDVHQNPKKCDRILICEGKTNSKNLPVCGWGCMIHFVLKCLRAAFSTGRVLVLNRKSFGLNQHFLPLSRTCNIG